MLAGQQHAVTIDLFGRNGDFACVVPRNEAAGAGEKALLVRCDQLARDAMDGCQKRIVSNWRRLANDQIIKLNRRSDDPFEGLSASKKH